MKAIKKILVPLDGSKNSLRGLDNAIYLSRQCGSTITGIFVIPSTKSVFEPIRYDRKLMQKEGNRLMKSAKIRSAQKGILFRHKISSGNPGKEIVEYARKNNFDLIVIGARGIGAVKETFLGSTSQYVSHKAKSPVVIVK